MGWVGTGFPVGISGVEKLECRTHKRHFTMLHPLVHEDMPATVVVQPELVVLNEGPVLLREAYEELAMQVRLQVRPASRWSRWTVLVVVNKLNGAESVASCIYVDRSTHQAAYCTCRL